MELSPSFNAGSRALLNAELRHDLFQIEYLLTTLRTALPEAIEQVYDIAWLRNRHRFLNTVLARRRKLQQGKVVDLAAWRRAASANETTLADVA
ncbi:MAG TPA: hypothetical protein VG328_07270 [Stellaceae bacterium]|nr:hypothetical protein [Stellaceae bacterium]